MDARRAACYWHSKSQRHRVFAVAPAFNAYAFHFYWIKRPSATGEENFLRTVFFQKPREPIQIGS